MQLQPKLNHRGRRRLSALLFSATLGAALVAGTAQAAGGGGGTGPPGDPTITNFSCSTNCISARKGTVGSKVKILGGDLENTIKVKIPSKEIEGEFVVVKKFSKIKPGQIVFVIPKGVTSGQVKVVDSFGGTITSADAMPIGTPKQLEKAQSHYRFPVRGAHTYGDGIGAGRGHQGQDILAHCKIRVVAAHTGKVIERANHPDGAAGNYVMIWDKKNKRTYIYMHFIHPSVVHVGDQVSTGQLIGKVGQTGRATGCHLHFELRAGKGWGAKVLNPTPLLKQWDANDKKKKKKK